MSKPRYRLYHYWRSSCSWRVRFALEWKQIAYEPYPVHLLNGESESAEHLARNPAGFVPALEILDGPFQGQMLTESLAIIQFLEDEHPEGKTVFPGNSADRAKIRALAEVINSGTQPIQNIPVMNFHSSDAAEQKRWAQHWIENGLRTFEALCSENPHHFSHSDQLSLADLCLIPQIYNAERFEGNVHKYPRIMRVFDRCKNFSEFFQSHPDRFQPDEFKK